MTLATFAPFWNDPSHWLADLEIVYDLLCHFSLAVALAWPDLPTFTMYEFSWAVGGFAVQQGLTYAVEYYAYVRTLGAKLIRRSLIGEGKHHDIEMGGGGGGDSGGGGGGGGKTHAPGSGGDASNMGGAAAAGPAKVTESLIKSSTQIIENGALGPAAMLNEFILKRETAAKFQRIEMETLSEEASQGEEQQIREDAKQYRETTAQISQKKREMESIQKAVGDLEAIAGTESTRRICA